MSLRARSPAPSPLLPQAQESRSPAPPSSRPRDPGPIVFLPQDLGFWAPIPPPRIQGPESPTPSSPRPKRPSRLPLNPRILWATLWRPPVREAGGAEGAQEPAPLRRSQVRLPPRSKAGRGHVAAPGGSRALTSLGTCRAREGGGSPSSKALDASMGEAGMSLLPGGWQRRRRRRRERAKDKNPPR